MTAPKLTRLARLINEALTALHSGQHLRRHTGMVVWRAETDDGASVIIVADDVVAALVAAGYVSLTAHATYCEAVLTAKGLTDR